MSVLFKAATLKATHGSFNEARRWAKETHGVTARDWTTLCYKLSEAVRERQPEDEGCPAVAPQVLATSNDIKAEPEPVAVAPQPLDVTTARIIRVTLWRSLLLVLWALRDRWLDCDRLLRWAYSQCLLLWDNDPGAGLMREVKLAFSDE